MSNLSDTGNAGANRILARELARELNPAEIAGIGGGGPDRCTRSTCGRSDWNDCDLDWCGDFLPP